MKTSNSRVLLSFELFFIHQKNPDKSGPPKGLVEVLLLFKERCDLDQIRRNSFVDKRLPRGRPLLSWFSATPQKFCNGVELNLQCHGDQMDDVRKPRQRHRQRTGLLDPSHFQAGIGRSPFWHCIRSRAGLPTKALNSLRTCSELRGILDLVLGNASQAVNKAF